MKNMPNDPKYLTNTNNFFGVEKANKKNQGTYADRLKRFIGS